MKITFFLVTLFLILLSAYFVGHAGHRGQDQGTMVIGSDDDHVKIQWAGKIVFTDDETGIKSISPGGYLRFHHNDVYFLASADVKGEISYDLGDGDMKYMMNEPGRQFIARCVTDILAYGFDANGRMNRVYASGGDSALLVEAAKQRGDGLRVMYIEYALKDAQLTESGLMTALGSIGTLQGDWDKSHLLKTLIDSSPLSDTLFTMILRIAGGIRGDYDRCQLYAELIDKHNLEDEEWIQLINASAGIRGEYDRSNLLARIGRKLPKTPALRAAFVHVAGTIRQDGDFGRAMRSLQDSL